MVIYYCWSFCVIESSFEWRCISCCLCKCIGVYWLVSMTKYLRVPKGFEFVLTRDSGMLFIRALHLLWLCPFTRIKTDSDFILNHARENPVGAKLLFLFISAFVYLVLSKLWRCMPDTTWYMWYQIPSSLHPCIHWYLCQEVMVIWSETMFKVYRLEIQ